MKTNRTFWMEALFLAAGFLVCRFALLPAHGMREWPQVMLLPGAAVMAVAAWKRLPVLGGFAAAGYLVSFGIGWLLQADGVDPGGGRTNNLWLIWLISDLCLCALGYAAEVLMRRKRSRESEKRPS